MSTERLLFLLSIGAILLLPVLIGLGALWQRTAPGSLWSQRLFWQGVGVVGSVPILTLFYVVGHFAVANFPFTSGIVASASAPTGLEVCVVQTFKGAEPYQVSLYARRPGQPWTWNYLAHQDDRWRDGRVRLAGGHIEVYRGSDLAGRFPLDEATGPRTDPADQLPGTYTPQQILKWHDTHYSR